MPYNHLSLSNNVSSFLQVQKMVKVLVAIVVLIGMMMNARVIEGRKTRKLDNDDNIEYAAINCRSHSASITEFGGVGDGKTSNTRAFKTAVDHLSKFGSDGGALLFVPPGKWLTGSFNLTSHFTLFLHKDAVLLASQVCFTILS